MILHLLTDEKFSGYAIKQFSGAEMRSEFIIVSDSENLKYIEQGLNISIVNPQTPAFFSIVNNLGQYNAIILHGLFWPWQEEILKSVPDNVKVGWVFWGGDIYGRSDLKNKFLSRKSKRLLSLHKAISLTKGRKEVPVFEIPKSLLSRIDFCLTDIQEDLSFVSDYLEKEMQGLWYNYYSIEQTVGLLADSVCQGNNILLGNSSTLECNHIDAIDILKKVKPSGSIIAPLSYGTPWVRNIISRYGKAKLKEKFLPLDKFMPLEEYNKIILSCSCVVMPHYRPQAFGNIITSLWLGCRVYLSNKNHLLAFFKRKGFIIFSIEEDLCKCPNLCSLSPEQTEQNRTILRKLYSVSTMRLKNIELVNTLES